MIKEYKTIREIASPLMVVEHVEGVTYDELVEKVMQETDPAVAAELTLQADAVASNDYVCIPLYYKTNDYLMKDYVSGVYMTASSNMYFQNAVINK